MNNDVTNALIALPLSAVGLVLALDLGGFTKWHVRTSYQAVSFLRYMPPWRWLGKANEETLVRRGVIQERITGSIFATVGLVLLASSLIHALS